MAKRVVRKKPTAKKVVVPRVVPDAELDPVANDRARNDKQESKEPANTHAKSVHVIFSVGTEDRDRSIEEFIEDLRKKVGPLEPPFAEWKCADCKKKVGNTETKCPNCGSKKFTIKRKSGVHMAITGEHYILDGKVCLPEDYDEKAQNFKPGAVPPTWAGGPSRKEVSITTQLQRDLAELTTDEYEEKYNIGKYAARQSAGKLITPEMQRVAMERYRMDKLQKEDEALEEIDWDEVEEAADQSTAAAVKKLTSGKKKKIKVAKKTAPKKKTVRIKK